MANLCYNNCNICNNKNLKYKRAGLLLVTKDLKLNLIIRKKPYQDERNKQWGGGFNSNWRTNLDSNNKNWRQKIYLDYWWEKLQFPRGAVCDCESYLKGGVREWCEETGFIFDGICYLRPQPIVVHWTHYSKTWTYVVYLMYVENLILVPELNSFEIIHVNKDTMLLNFFCQKHFLTTKTSESIVNKKKIQFEKLYFFNIKKTFREYVEFMEKVFDSEQNVKHNYRELFICIDTFLEDLRRRNFKKMIEIKINIY